MLAECIHYTNVVCSTSSSTVGSMTTFYKPFIESIVCCYIIFGKDIPKSLTRKNWEKLLRLVEKLWGSCRQIYTICTWPGWLSRQTRSAWIHPIHFLYSFSHSLLVGGTDTPMLEPTEQEIHLFPWQPLNDIRCGSHGESGVIHGIRDVEYNGLVGCTVYSQYSEFSILTLNVRLKSDDIYDNCHWRFGLLLFLFIWCPFYVSNVLCCTTKCLSEKFKVF